MRAIGKLLALAAGATLVLGSGTGNALDEVGIFFDQVAEQNCIEAEVYSTLDAYLIILEPSASGGVGGWACYIDSENAMILGVEYSGGGAINVATVPEFVVGLASPLPAGPTVELAKVSVMVSGNEPVGFFLLPSTMASDLDQPIYADGSDPDILLPLSPRTIGTESLVAGINRPNCIPESATWGRVKLIYE